MLLKKITLSICLVIAAFFDCFETHSQATFPTADFKVLVKDKLETAGGASLKKVCPVESDATAKRIFSEYGAIFAAEKAVKMPFKCIFSDEAEMQDYQVRANPQSAQIEGVLVILQKPALEALLRAEQDAARKNLRISPRGTLAAKRSFAQTLTLWNSRFIPGLAHWVGQKKISASEADKVKKSDVRDQVTKVLEWESKGWFFGKGVSKSILLSVAAPGASQHNFMLALDVKQFASREVRKILAENGWFQTVKSDLPHFTYLGVKEKDLPSLGLKATTVGKQIFWIPNV